MAAEPSFGELLREHRRVAGLSQEGLAERASLSVGAIAAIEQGVRRAPYRSTVEALSNALGLSPTGRRRLDEVASSARRRHLRSTGNLPASLTSFIDRNEVNELIALADDHRLVTITGAGGIGKTRIAIEVAKRLESTCDEAWFVDFIGIRDGSAVPGQIVAQFGEVSEHEAVSFIARRFRELHALLLLDNCEHVITDVAALVAELALRCPSLTILVTSREALDISGEFAFRLPSMDARTGTELFVARAQASDRAWQADAPRLTIIAQICKKLDGIPLAIELAASRVSALAVEAMLTRLHGGLALSGNRDLPARHQTMSATIAWSYDLLSEHERLLFRRASIAATSFTLESAEHICADEALPVAAIADVLAQLVQKSLINAEHGATSTRYRYLEAIRVFARERLSEIGEFDRMMRRSVAWLEREASVVEKAQSSLGLLEYRADFDNVWAVIKWASDVDDNLVQSAARLLVGYARVFCLLGRQGELRTLGLMLLDRLNGDSGSVLFARLVHAMASVVTSIEHMELAPRAIPLLELDHEFAAAAHLHARTAHIEHGRGNATAAKEHVGKAAALLSEKANRHSRTAMVTAVTCAYTLSQLGDFTAARAWLEEMEIPPGDTYEIESKIVLADIEFEDGNIQRAAELLKSCQSEALRYPEFKNLLVMAFCNYSRCLMHLGVIDSAERALREGLRYALPALDSSLLVVVRFYARNAAAFACLDGRVELGLRLLGACDATDEYLGFPSYNEPLTKDIIDRRVADLLSPERAAALRANRKAEDLSELLEEFLAQPAATESARPSETSSPRATSEIFSSPN